MNHKPPVIIGISGKKGSGKSTIATMIHDLMPSNYKIYMINFADPLKEEVAAATGMTRAAIEMNKDRFRTMLQWWGTDFRRWQNPDYWIERYNTWLCNLTPHADIIVTADVRFMNEALFLKSRNAHLWRIFRSMSDNDNHPSETDLDTFKFDKYITNYHTLDALKSNVLEALQDISTLQIN